MLGMIIAIQIITGLVLSWRYIPRVELGFASVLTFQRERDWGNLLRWRHLNGASFIFMFLYLHLRRGLIFRSFRLKEVWWRGVSLLLLVIGVAFLGYVLPWGQISLWGATVITNLVSAIPVIGGKIVIWVWGGFSVGQPTLSLFFSLHFLLPFLIIPLGWRHLTSLHATGRTSSLIRHWGGEKVNFGIVYAAKDGLNLAVLLLGATAILCRPYYLGDRENFIEANIRASPLHIKPEWYFLYAYAMLRSVPNKLGGVIVIGGRLLVFYFLPLLANYQPNRLRHQAIVVRLLIVSALLTWVGGSPVEYPFIEIGQALTCLYFLLLMLLISR